MAVLLLGLEEAHCMMLLFHVCFPLLTSTVPLASLSRKYLEILLSSFQSVVPSTYVIAEFCDDATQQLEGAANRPVMRYVVLDHSSSRA
eukprot:GHVS01097308.1.p1 GENE.GHVS01097308.1~~GHVS01097308.1.p1  ORF type:complete len:101 (-),score=13.92 GHVS01097308.1:267-533(-)